VVTKRRRPTSRSTIRRRGTGSAYATLVAAARTGSLLVHLCPRLGGLAPPPGDYPLAGHPDVRTVLVYAADDEFFDPAWERFMAREALGVEPIEIPGGHFPMAEDPGALADLLDRLARESYA